MKSSPSLLQLDKACAKQWRVAQPIYVCIYIHIHAYVHMSSVVSNSLQPRGSVNCQAPLSMGFPGQEYWSGLPFPSPGDLLDRGIEQIGDYQGLGVRGVRSVSLLLLSHFSRVRLCDPIDGSPPGFASLGFSRQEHWSGLPFPSPMHESEK